MGVVVCLYGLGGESRLKRKFRGFLFFFGVCLQGCGVVFGRGSVGKWVLFPLMGGFYGRSGLCLVLFCVVGVYVFLVEIVS